MPIAPAGPRSTSTSSACSRSPTSPSASSAHTPSSSRAALPPGLPGRGGCCAPPSAPAAVRCRRASRWPSTRRPSRRSLTALPRRLHERGGTRTLVVFDEFQDVLAAKDRLDAVIRSEIQHHGDAASYVFAGSHVGMMRELFADRRRAFYGQAAPVELPPLSPEDVAEYVAGRFEQNGRDVGEALDPLLELGAGHPQRTMLLAHALFEHTPPDHAATNETWQAAYEDAMHQVRDELRAIWSALPTSQRRVLTAVAENADPLYATGRSHGGSRGGAVRGAIRMLEDRGEIAAERGARTGYRLTDPLLAAWIREGRAGT